MEFSWAVGYIPILLLRGGGSVALKLGTPCSLKVWRSLCGSHQPSTHTEDKRLDFTPIYAFRPSNQRRIHFVPEYGGNSDSVWQPPPPQAGSQEAPFLDVIAEVIFGDHFSFQWMIGMTWQEFLRKLQKAITSSLTTNEKSRTSQQRNRTYTKETNRNDSTEK